ncbi:histidine phosphatase superfamily [Aspergillus avenaceus]|uniref:Histidine phosphatase superfamily n=1 Tax=Aspergillus avenaceus TaxID=36643 RepID=A0A5N6U3P3_ASPAV|nr:histidine phosphatase superfamily [Aspergillus avenaceus]
MIALLVTLLSGTPSLASRDSFYPPLNHTTFITNSSLGTYGGIYSAPGDQPSTIGDVYNYCAMPHPHVDTYALPPPVANNSVSAKILYLEYLQRHQRRTPYNLLPGGENQEYNCDSIHPHLFAAPANPGTPPAAVYGQAYSDSSNPFLTTYVKGTCQYPQLTIGGLLDGYQHGRDLRAVYGDELGLIPDSPTDQVWFRSSSAALTQGSAGGVLRGIFPDHEGPIPLHQQASGIDTVNRGFPCSARDRVLSAIQSTAEWNEHLSVTEQLRTRLSTMFNATSSWTSTFDHFADNFQARLCNGYALPCRVEDRSDCVSTEQANEVFRAGDWEWNYWWRRNANATQYIQLVEGLFLGEIVRKLEAVEQGTSDLVYSHNFVHDGDIGPILGALGIKALRWPGMASNIAIEIWQTATTEYYARVLYSGSAIETVHGTLDWIPLTRLIDILKPFLPDDIIAMCN